MFPQLDPASQQRINDETAERSHQFAALTHAVFKANPQGAQWLEMARESFLFKQPVADPRAEESHAYFREGMNTFIRNIYVTIQNVEQDAKNSQDVQPNQGGVA